MPKYRAAMEFNGRADDAKDGAEEEEAVSVVQLAGKVRSEKRATM